MSLQSRRQPSLNQVKRQETPAVRDGNDGTLCLLINLRPAHREPQALRHPLQILKAQRDELQPAERSRHPQDDEREVAMVAQPVPTDGTEHLPTVVDVGRSLSDRRRDAGAQGSARCWPALRAVRQAATRAAQHRAAEPGLHRRGSRLLLAPASRPTLPPDTNAEEQAGILRTQVRGKSRPRPAQPLRPARDGLAPDRRL